MNVSQMYKKTGTDESGTEKLSIANYIKIFGRILSVRVYSKGFLKSLLQIEV